MLILGVIMPDYIRMFAQNHPVLITISTYNKQPILKNRYKLIIKSWNAAKEKFNFNIFAYCILPDHVHLILELKSITEYPKIIGFMKWYFSKNIDSYFRTPESLPDSKKEKERKRNLAKKIL